jgi:dCTP deaminase
MQQPAFDELLPDVGYLTDAQIEKALAAGYLIEEGTWESSQVRHASYTIRLGQRVEIERYQSGQSGPREKVSLSLKKGDNLELRPGDTAMLYSLETLRLPKTVLAFTVARGLLVVESLVPENTYVDPGFVGSIYTTVTNLSGRNLKLPYGANIARLFFFRLSQPVRRPYRSGPAIGIDQHLESSPGSAFSSPEACLRASNASLLADLVSSDRAGARTAELLRRQTRLARVALVMALFVPLALQLLLAWPAAVRAVGPLVLWLLSTLVAWALGAMLDKILIRYQRP